MAIRVLVASNNTEISDMLREQLAAVDCELLLAREISLALYLAHKNLPDVILCDTNLTKNKGLDYLSEIKSDEELSPVPFFFLSSNADLFRQEARAAGANDVLDAESGEQIMKRVQPFLHERKIEREPQTPE